MARTSGRTSDRARRKRKRARQRTRRAVARSVTQMAVVLVGGVGAGGLVVLAAFPPDVQPVPPLACLVGAAVVGLVTLVMARRLQPQS